VPRVTEGFDLRSKEGYRKNQAQGRPRALAELRGLRGGQFGHPLSGEREKQRRERPKKGGKSK